MNAKKGDEITKNGNPLVIAKKQLPSQTQCGLSGCRNQEWIYFPNPNFEFCFFERVRRTRAPECLPVEAWNRHQQQLLIDIINWLPDFALAFGVDFAVDCLVACLVDFETDFAADFAADFSDFAADFAADSVADFAADFAWIFGICAADFLTDFLTDFRVADFLTDFCLRRIF